jgi:hypothetical protein
VVGLYLNPPQQAIVLCVEEKNQIQALDRTQPGLPHLRGRHRQPSEAQQHGIEKGKLEGQKLTFEVTEGPTPLVFDLPFDGESIQGKMSGHADGHSRSTRLHLKRIGPPTALP